MSISNRFLEAFSKDELSMLAVNFAIIPPTPPWDMTPQARKAQRRLEKKLQKELQEAL